MERVSARPPATDLVLPHPRHKERLGQQAKSEERLFYVIISLWGFGFLLFSLGPLLASIFFSFNFYDVIRPPRWRGLGNYSALLVDPLFWQALKVTSLYSLGGVGLGMVASLATALLLNRKIHGMNWFRTLFYLPAVISGVAVSLLWMWIFNPDIGLLNDLLWSLFHIKGPGWIYVEAWALPSLVIMSLWGVGGSVVIYLASLQGIPTELYEAAEIDGAGAWKRLLMITLPMMSPVILFNLIMGIIGSFQVFTQAYVMTQGGPHNATLFYVLDLYRYAFQYFQLGYASALAWVLFLILLALTLLVLRSATAWVYYEEPAAKKEG